MADPENSPIGISIPASADPDAVSVTPVQATPVQATPVEATPVEATPVQATPVQATPVEATPVEATPVEAPAKRTLSVARALTRIKTIKAQLERITKEIRQYGAWSNQSILPIGDPKATLDKNQSQSMAYIKGLYQQHNDLSIEIVKLKTAISMSNADTKITVAGKTMTITEAQILQNDVKEYKKAMINAADCSVRAAEMKVAQYNSTVQSLQANNPAAAAMMADVLYLVPKDQLDKEKKFLNEFLAELNGVLNETNPITLIELD